MAKKKSTKSNQRPISAPKAGKKSSSSVTTNTFTKGMNKDITPSFEPNNSWYHAINAANYSSDGDLGVIGNEPANLQCGVIPYTVIGAIHRYGDEWVVYSTDDISSEIGRFDDSECKYETIVNDPCLNFKKKFLITGAAKENFDCTWQVYWDDGNNPSRSMNIDNVPYLQNQISGPSIDGDPCLEFEDSTFLDCEKIRLHPLVDTPCVKLTKATDGGTLLNGAYQAYIAYTENEQVVTDYIGISNIQTLWSHRGSGGSLDIEVSNLDKDYFYFDLVLLIRQQGQIYTKRIGNYSTEVAHINVDYIDQSLVSIDFEELFRQSPLYEKSEAMYVVNDYLIRQGPTEQFDFNYQPLANNIKTHWVINEVTEQYYYDAGNKIGFMRDEQYAFFIRWIYNTGERSKSYHIPGRAPRDYTLPNGVVENERSNIFGTNVLDPNGDPLFKVYNTATVTSLAVTPAPDGIGSIVARGEMGYWESTERYPDKTPEIWNSSSHTWSNEFDPGAELCGEFIRHHKMPNEMIDPILSITDNNDSGIRILGVEFSNIKRPVFNDGTVIPNIIGYEILRGSRLGNRTILAKGMFKNMREYTVPDTQNLISNAQGLYPNYPYNDLRGDVFHTTVRRTEGCRDGIAEGVNGDGPNKPPMPALTGFRKDVFTFHSPDLMISKPYLNAYETVFYGQIDGKAQGGFIPSENHPQQKLLRNIASYIGAIIGIGYGIRNINGTPDTRALPVQAINSAYPEWKINEIDGKRHSGGGGNVTATVPPAVATAFLSPRSGGQISGGDGDNNEKGPNAETDAHEAINDYYNSQTGGLFGGIGQWFTDLIAGGASDLLDQFGLGDTLQDRLQEQALENISNTTGGSQNGMGLMGGGSIEGTTLDSSESNLSKVFRIAMTGVLTQKNIAVGGQEIIDLIYNLTDFQEHSLKYNSHGFYSNFTARPLNNVYRTLNNAANYIGSSFSTFDNNKFKINNLFRPSTVAVSTQDEIAPPTGDDSRFALGGYVDANGQGFNWPNVNNRLKNPEGPFGSNISALYGALKFNMDNQYGQLDGVKQVQMRGCVEYVDLTASPNLKYTSQPIFGGDVFIARYTEKHIMPLFTDFLMGQYDGFPYDYFLRYNIPYPRFWVDSRKFDMGSMASLVASFGLAAAFNPNLNAMPNDYYFLDRGDTCSFGFGAGFIGDGLNYTFAMNHAYMYTHINGVNDFYVETEINLPYRDWEEPKERRFYDQYTYNNLNDLFHAEIQKYDNFYKYDESLSPSKFVTQQSNFAEIQPRDYNPEVAETCYTAYPKRLIYSLQANEEDRKDYWRQYLFANYKDFKNRVSVIKPYSKSGALIFFPFQSPQAFEGYDTLKTDANTKITIGDGGLFKQKLINVVNSDLSNEYGSLESQRGIINTPVGLFYISQAQGKIFQYMPGKGLEAISNAGMKWWFNKYLPSRFVRQFPAAEETEWADNPVVGVGCQVMYDPNDDIVYFMKKDFQLKTEFIAGAKFIDNISNPVALDVGAPKPIFVAIGDPVFFEDCSWTISYDPKAKAWISFHDWHPEFALPSINHFFTTKTILSETPICPPGYSFNPSTGLCEFIIDVTEPREVIKDDIPAIVTGGPQDCLIDIVICMDASGSTGDPDPGTNSLGDAQLTWLVAFINDTAIQAGLQNGTIQIGFQAWATGTFQLNVTGQNRSMETTQAGSATPITGAQVRTQYQNNWTSTNGISFRTNPGVARTNGLAQLNDKANSALSADYPARSADPNFRQILICVTDGTQITTGADPIAPNSFTAFQSNTIVPGATGPANQQLLAVFVGPNSSNPTDPVILDQWVVGSPGVGPSSAYYNTTTNTPAPGQFTMNASIPSTLTATATAVAADICSIPFECECPTGYTLIYPDLGGTGFYTQQTGTCDDINPPICRKVECPDCPQGPVNTVTTELGTCPDTFPELGYIGDPNWIDPTPPLCNYYFADTVIANYNVGSFWRHNVRCDLFANYYGKDYPWEVELISNTGQTVNTIRSVEYQLETFVYKGEPEYNMCGGDKWEDLLFNFDKAIIYNNEQVSGLLNLVSQPFNDPWGGLNYPIVTPIDMSILASKVEQKFRFNQFWDITNDRGEFSNAEQSVFDTQCNGYIRPLNQTNLNYFKPQTERKKFRHYSNHVLLRRQRSDNRKMLLRLDNTKLLQSMR